MAEITHRFVDANGIRIHLAEAGPADGPVVMMCHGFPESWYSYRHQLRALGDAGYHAVAPDMRGYGQTTIPTDVREYTQLHCVGDVIGIADELQAQRFVVVGHDWGAPVAWNTAMMRPDRVRGVVGLSVPHLPRGPVSALQGMRAAFGDRFYMQYFQEPGVAEKELERDVRSTMLRSLYGGSGDAPEGRELSPVVPEGGGFTTVLPEPETLPAWLTEQDVDFYTKEFERTGFTGGLNWYRVIDLSHELTAPFIGMGVSVPALYITGDRDIVYHFPGLKDVIPVLNAFIPNLRETIVLPGCGHWTQQERPDEVNAAMLSFLASVDEGVPSA